MILPRQAQDKHREYPKGDALFLTLQTFRGVVFYQGESNSVRGGNAQAAEYYGCAVRALIDDWRRRFANGHDLAFHQVHMREKHYNCRLFGAVQCSAQCSHQKR